MADIRHRIKREIVRLKAQGRDKEAARLQRTVPPKTIQRGTMPVKPIKSPVVTNKPSTVEDVVRGQTMRRRVRKGTQ